ncbi:MAG: YbhN family protein, partial [Candidatus Binatia bacterium]
TWSVYGIKLKLLTALFRVRLAWTEAVGVYIISVFFNYLLFLVGFAFKGVYLKRHYGLPYPAFAAISCLRAVGVLLAAGLAGPFLILVSDVPLSTSWPLVLFFLAVGVLGAAAFLLQTRLPALRFGWLVPLTAFVEGWRDIRDQPKQVSRIMLLELFGIGLYAVRLYIAFRALGEYVPLTACGVMAFSAVLTSFINLTPGGLVVQEAVAAFVAMAFGVTFQVGLSAAVLDRAIDVIWAVAAGLVLSFIFAWREDKPMPSRQMVAVRSESEDG